MVLAETAARPLEPGRWTRALTKRLLLPAAHTLPRLLQCVARLNQPCLLVVGRVDVGGADAVEPREGALLDLHRRYRGDDGGAGGAVDHAGDAVLLLGVPRLERLVDLVEERLNDAPQVRAEL